MTVSSITTSPASSLLESLRKNNPFTSNAASDPWFNRFPDVPSINRLPFEEIRALIVAKATAPMVPLAGLIIGEAGMGKTHLLRRILMACQQSEPQSLFVFVKPLFDPKRPLHHLLQEIVLNLSKNNEGEHAFSQFERLVAEIIRDYVRHRVAHHPPDATPNNKCFLEQFEKDVFHIFTNRKKVRAGSMEIIEKEAVRYIHSEVPETSKRFLDVIFQYKTSEKRGLVRDWLKGSSLDEDDCKILGVDSRANLSDEALEQEAREMLLTLGVLFARYRLPMVLCFDQLDNLIQPELIRGFESMIYLLVNDAANMLPLAFIRADSWNERFKKHSDRPFSDRLESNKFPLSNCDTEEAKVLVSRRIEQIFGEKTNETVAIEKWLLAALEQKLIVSANRSPSPREVILFANQIIRDASAASKPVLPTVSESLAAEYKNAYEAVAADFDAWDPESEYLKKAAELFLKNQESVLTCSPGKDKYATWVGYFSRSENGQSDKKIPYACFINTAKHWQTVLAALERCNAFLKKYPSAVCTYITDARCGFSPTWKVVAKQRAMFEALGGNVMVLEQTAVVRWYGVVSLSWKVGSGDIFLESEGGGLVTASQKDLAEFLKNDLLPQSQGVGFDLIFFDKKKVITQPIPLISRPIPPIKLPQPSDKKLIDAVCQVLSAGVIPILNIDIIMAKLKEKGIDVTLEFLLERIGKNQNAVVLLPSRDGFMVRSLRV